MDVNKMSDAALLMALCGSTGRTLAKRPLTEIFGMVTPRQTEFFASENTPQPYVTNPQIAVAKELYLRALQENMETSRVELTNPTQLKAFLCGRIGHLQYEVFWCVWLDSQNKLIKAEEMARGTINETAVYPREIVKRALELNAARVVYSHNHPSGNLTPSSQDLRLTNNLKAALQLVDVRSLDHLIVSGGQAMSMAETGQF